MAEVTGIPRWLELQAEIDYRIFLLNEMRSQLEAEDGRLGPLDRLIDEATGHDAARLAEANEIIAEIKTLKAEWDALASDEGDGAAEQPEPPAPDVGHLHASDVAMLARVTGHIPNPELQVEFCDDDGG